MSQPKRIACKDCRLPKLYCGMCAQRERAPEPEPEQPAEWPKQKQQPWKKRR